MIANQIDELLSPTRSSTNDALNIELPYYLCITLNRNRHRRQARRSARRHSGDASDVRFGNRQRRQFWYTVPREKADCLYNFLLQWQPVNGLRLLCWLCR